MPTNSLVFFGSGPVAAESLELLYKDFEIEAVVTKPQPPHHKETFPVLEVAKRLGLKVLHTSNKKDLVELFAGKPVTSKLGIVIDYGIIIPQEVIDYFPLGIINSHFSLLPRWRGADPITFAILSGDTVTGVSIMQIVEALDEGPIFSVGLQPITPETTTPSLTSQLIKLSHGLLQGVVPQIFEGSVRSRDQSEFIAALNEAAGIQLSPEPTYSRKLSKADGVLDFSIPAVAIDCEIRAYLGWPGSRAVIAGKDVLVTKAHVVDTDINQSDIGVPFRTADKKIGITTGAGVLIIDKLKPAGKAEMTAEGFLAGHGSLL